MAGGDASGIVGSKSERLGKQACVDVIMKYLLLKVLLYVSKHTGGNDTIGWRQRQNVSWITSCQLSCNPKCKIAARA